MRRIRDSAVHLEYLLARVCVHPETTEVKKYKSGLTVNASVMIPNSAYRACADT